MIFYYYTYYGLSNTIRVVVWNFIGLMRNEKFGPHVDVWLE